MRPRWTFFSSMHRLPLRLGQARFRQYSVPSESDSEITLPPRSMTLRDSVLRDVAGTRDGHAFAFDGFTATLEHFLGEVHATETGGFRADQAAAVAQALAGAARW